MGDLADRPAASAALARALVEWMLPDTEQRPDILEAVPDSTTEPGDSSTPRWDRASALERLGGDARFLAQILSAFRSDMAMRVAVLDKAIAAKDTASAHLHAVSVQLAAAKLGADALEAAARRLDQAIVAGNHTAARRLLRRLAESTEQLATALGLPEAKAIAAPALTKPRSRRRAAR
ncbi:MAG: hypothetical protein HZB16_09375 [Armatimonadetes bacterium]|nr:hypothetical protein [Armatimonadota bacterium]